MAALARTGLTAFCRSCCNRITPTRKLTTICPIRLYSNASANLLSALKKELQFEQKTIQKLPTVTSFTSTIDGCLATLVKTHGNEEVKVQLDANSAVELDMMQDDAMEDVEVEEEEEHHDSEKSFGPTFTVSLKKPSGITMQFDCSFDVFFNELVDAEQVKMRIDSISVVPVNTKQVESVYTADEPQLGEDLHTSLLEYLDERGIGEKFGEEILNFYETFEHRCYVKNFLEEVQNFCSSS